MVLAVTAEMTSTGPAPAAPVSAYDPSELGLGMVVPVLGAHSQAGTSGIALALADAAASAGLRVMLVDCADPARSGLAGVCAVEGRSVPGDQGRAALRFATRTLPRGVVNVRRLISQGTPMDAGQIPGPSLWAGVEADQFDLTVVDLGWDVWPLTKPGAQLGPLQWCMGTPSATFPLLVLRVGAASVGLAEGVLFRYLIGMQRLGFVDMYAAVALGGESWPQSSLVVMGHYLRRLIPRTLLVPTSPEAATLGWTTEAAPQPSVRAAATLLHNLGGPVAQAVGPPSALRKGRRGHRS